MNEDTRLLFNDLGKQISAESGDLREVSFSVSVVILHFNVVLLHNSFVTDHEPE